MAAKLGELLVNRGKLEAGRIESALRLQHESGKRIGVLLVQIGDVAERDVANALAEQLDLPLAVANDYRDIPDVDGSISPEFMLQANFIPIAEEDHEITVAMSDPTDEYTVGAIHLATGRSVKRCVGTTVEITAALKTLLGDGASSLADIMEPVFEDAGDDESAIEQLRDLASEAPTIKVVNLIIARALEIRASDIHIEPFERRLKVRYRIDGVLREGDAPPARSTAAVISRVKIMSNLNIAENRLPQDGRVKIRVEGREIDLRVSTVPTMFGESVVLRILDKSQVPLDFQSLGFTADNLPSFEALVDRPHGIILVTGPTGSGKTTTLYAALQTLNDPTRKILTVEDPVEYQLDGINQIQVNPRIGLTFAGALRSILRQDPDVIMVGEIRDTETASIAVQAALTGHKVFSTLHTNNASSSVTRLLDMGIEDFLLTSTVRGILAQRLVRTLCQHCRSPYRAPADLVAELQLARPGIGDNPPLYESSGCIECDQTGFKGRTGILELMLIEEATRKVILKHGDAIAIQRAAIKAGMTTMYRDGLRKALDGVTSIEEVIRVTQEE